MTGRGDGPAERIRLVIAGQGPDAGAAVLARALRDAGMEVVYTDRQQTADELVETVVQEDADAIGLVGPDAALLARLAGLLQADDAVVFAVGVRPDADRPAPAQLFPPGADPGQVVGWLRGRAGA